MINNEKYKGKHCITYNVFFLRSKNQIYIKLIRSKRRLGTKDADNGALIIIVYYNKNFM